MKSVEVKVGNFNFIGWLTLLFIGLKLSCCIDWSWWFVLLPLYVLPALAVGIIVVGGGAILLLACIITLFEKILEKK